MKRIIIFFALAFMLPSIYGQNSLVNDITFENAIYYNPAISGSENGETNYYISGYTKHKLIESEEGVWKKPGNYMLNFTGKTNRKTGFYSAGYLFDAQSFYNRQSFFGGYGHNLSLGIMGKLTLGARIILNLDGMKKDKLQSPLSSDLKSTYFKPDLDFGLNYSVKGLNLWLSAKNIAKSKNKVSGIAVTENHTDLYGNISWDFRFSNFKLTPYIFAYRHRKTGIDLGMNVGAFEKFDFSYAFRLKELRSIVSVRATVYKGFKLGMSIDNKGLYGDNNLNILTGYSF